MSYIPAVLSVPKLILRLAFGNALASLTGSAFCVTPREFYALTFTDSLASIVVNVLRHVLSSLYHAPFVPCSTLSG